jgi:hypothetical protein
MLETQRRLGLARLASRVIQGNKLSAKRCALWGRSLGSGEVARAMAKSMAWQAGLRLRRA